MTKTKSKHWARGNGNSNNQKRRRERRSNFVFEGCLSCTNLVEKTNSKTAETPDKQTGGDLGCFLLVRRTFLSTK